MNGPEIIEEQFEGETLGVEVEHDDAEAAANVVEPYDPKLIRVDPKTFSVRSITEMIRDGELELAPDFQRNRVWRPFQKSRLIESILLRIPLPAFYFSADPDGKLRVVDGLQRLSTIYDFMFGGEDGTGGFALSDLEYLGRDLNGKRFSKLDASWVRRLQQTMLYANVIDPQTPERVLYDIFSRINTGGSPLNAQEIRHCMSGKRSREFLKRCAHHPLFLEATERALENHLRMADREVILRFCAFKLLDSFDNYTPTTFLDAFLSDATRKLDKTLTDEQLDELEKAFLTAMANARKLFGKHAFRKWYGDSDKLIINRALFESWSVALSEVSWEDIAPRADAIQAAFQATLAQNRDYDRAISQSTGDHRRVKLRFSVARTILRTGKPVLPASDASDAE